MKTLFFSDIHGNLEALEALLEALEEESPDRIVFLGDSVGYGANPNECIEIIQDISDVVLAGNHDCAVCGRTPVENFNDPAKQALVWSAETISDEKTMLLQNLPLKLTTKDFECVHSTPYEPERWDYLNTVDDALFYMERLEKQICFIGHTHKPAVFVGTPDGVAHTVPSDININGSMKYIINCGSAGQPRDRNPDGCFGIYDNVKRQFRFKRFLYPVDIAQEKIIRAGLPAYFARRLGTGS